MFAAKASHSDGYGTAGEKTDGAQRERQLQVRVRNENDVIVFEEIAPLVKTLAVRPNRHLDTA